MAIIDANITGGTESCPHLHMCMLNFFIISLFEFSCVIPKQFSGACPVLEVHTGFSADRLEHFGEVTTRNLWPKSDGTVDFSFSWNKNVGTLLFGPLLDPASRHIILRMASPTCPVGITGGVEMFIVNCRLLLSTTDWDRLATMAEGNCSSEAPKDGLDNMLMRHFDTVIFFRGHWTEELIFVGKLPCMAECQMTYWLESDAASPHENVSTEKIRAGVAEACRLNFFRTRGLSSRAGL